VYVGNVVISPINIQGRLFIQSRSKAIVIFVHDSGSGRYSAGNAFVSRYFNEHGISTLLVDLLTENEKEEDVVSKHFRFNVKLLTERLVYITKWVQNNKLTKHLSIGYFGSSTGVAAALNASIIVPEIKAIVSRGGHTDLVKENILHKILTPILFIVGQKDDALVNFNKRAYKEITSTDSKDICIIPKASHFFEEKGAIEEISRIASSWFKFYLLENAVPFVNSYNVKSSLFSSLFGSFDFKPRLQMKFLDRTSAGYMLADILGKYKNQKDVVILAIPRGGIIIADVVAKKLSLCGFNIALSKRLRGPYDLENTIGSVFQDGSVYLTDESKGFSEEYIHMEIKRQKKELERQISFFRISEEIYNFQGKTVILVDDGCYSGSTIMISSKWVRSHEPRKIVLATPVIPKYVFSFLSDNLDKIEYIFKPKKIRTVEQYYYDFSPIKENSIIKILSQRSRNL
jgi:putative phosphoribosyl transferase